MRSQLRGVTACKLVIRPSGCCWDVRSWKPSSGTGCIQGPRLTPAHVQKAFNTPQEAAETLIQAAETYDVSALLGIFGPDGKDFVSSADPIRDKSVAASFAAKAREKHVVAVDARDKTRAVLFGRQTMTGRFPSPS